MNLQIIKDNLYSRHFHVVTNVTNEVFLKALRNKHGADNEGVKKIERTLKNGCRGMFTADIETYVYIYLENFSGLIEEIGVLHHELNHFVDYVLDYVGIKGDLRNTEVRAYYYQYIYVKILRKIRSQFKKPKPRAQAKGTKARSNDKSKQTRERSRNTGEKKAGGRRREKTK